MLKIPFIGEGFKLSSRKLWSIVGQQLAGNPVDSKVNFHFLNYSFGRQIGESIHLEPSRVGVDKYQVLHSITIKCLHLQATMGDLGPALAHSFSLLMTSGQWMPMMDLRHLLTKDCSLLELLLLLSTSLSHKGGQTSRFC